MTDFLVEIQQLPLAKLHLSTTNPRRTFDKEADAELTESIRIRGVLNPILVRPHPEKKGEFEVIAGARRRRCAEDAGKEKIPCIVRTDLSEEEIREVQIVENLQRLDVHPLQEAEGFADYIKFTKRDVATLAARIGKDAAYITKRMKLADLIAPFKKRYLSKKMGLSHALILCRLTSDQQKTVEDWFVNTWDGCPSASELQNIVTKNFFLKILGAPWKLDDGELVKKAGPCSACPKLSSNSPALFDDVGKDTVCTDAKCYESKFLAFIAKAEKELGHALLRLSAQEYWPRDEKIVSKDKWEKTTPKDCEHGRDGIIVHGDGLGKIVSACLESTGCKTHWSKAATSRRESTETAAQKEKRLAEERDRKQEIAFRRRVLLEVEKKGPKGITDAAELVTVARALWGRTYHDLATKILKLRGWMPEKKKGESIDQSAIVDGKLKEMDAAQMSRFVLFLALTFNMDEAPSDYDYKTNKRTALPDPLMIYAESYGIDVKALRKEVSTLGGKKSDKKKSK